MSFSVPLLALLAATASAQTGAGAPAAAASITLAPAPDPSDAEARADARAAASVVDVVEQLGHTIPDASFMDSLAFRASLRDLTARGKPVLLTLVYFDCPMLCSLVQNGIIKGLNQTDLQLGRDYYGLTVSFSPKDGPKQALERQHGYLQALQSAQGGHVTDWPFLTGSAGSIRTLADAVGFRYRWDEVSQQFEHPAVSVVITPDGRVSRYLYGVEFRARELKLAVIEAGEGKVGTVADRIILKCFKYDPASRRYDVYVWGILRLGAGACGLALFAFLGVMWTRELRKGKVA